MTDRQVVFTGILIGLAIYTPVSIYFFDGSLPIMLDRAYFTLGGAAIALYAPRDHVSGAKERSDG